MKRWAVEPSFCVLLVTDHPCQPAEIDRLLRLAGLTRACLEHAGSLSQAVGRVADQNVGAVLVDLSTADADGLSALVRLQSIAPGLPVLAYAGPDDARPLAQAHAVTCLQRAMRKRQQERRLLHVATHDQLTGLANRLLLEDRVKQALARTRRYQKPGAVYFIDLDGFKSINDRYGHEAGNMLLRSIGHRLTHSLRASDTSARLGGDEFVVLMERISDRPTAELARSRLQALIAQPHRVLDQDLTIEASIGMAMFPDDAQDLDTLLRVADSGMYQEKRARQAQAAAR